MESFLLGGIRHRIQNGSLSLKNKPNSLSSIGGHMTADSNFACRQASNGFGIHDTSRVWCRRRFKSAIDSFSIKGLFDIIVTNGPSAATPTRDPHNR